MTDVVIDATIVLKWFLPELDDAACLRLLNSPIKMHAPTLLAVQVGQALGRRTKTGHVTQEVANRVMATMHRLPIRWTGDAELSAAALRITQLSSRSFPDAVYFALAAKLDAPVVSADRRWCQIVGSGPLCDWVRFVGDVSYD